MTKGRTPKLSELIERGAAQVLRDVHTCIAAVVVSYDAATQTADVQPAIKEAYLEQDYDPAPFVGVPVKFPVFGDWVICAPLAVGQEVLLHVVERSTDEWIERGGRVGVPSDPRTFDEDDVFVDPGVIPRNKSLPATVATNNSLVLASRDGTTRIEIAAGEVTINGASVKIGDASALPLAKALEVTNNYALLNATLAPIIAAWTAAAAAGGPLLVPVGAVIPPFVPGAVATTKAKGV